MKRGFLVALLVMHAVGWAAAAVQGVLLQISPKGVSLDAFLFGGAFAALSVGTLWLARRVWSEDQRVLALLSAVFGLLGALGALVGVVMLIASTGPTDSYIGPLGGLGLVGGLVHLAAAGAAFSIYRDAAARQWSSEA